MKPSAHAAKLLAGALQSMWSTDGASHRCRTLARLAQHGRQIEGWWKCELAAHLWDHVHEFGDDVYVWLEVLDRADVAIARGTKASGRLIPVPDGAICIPIELKTIGTWWGATESAIGKASASQTRSDSTKICAMRAIGADLPRHLRSSDFSSPTSGTHPTGFSIATFNEPGHSAVSTSWSSRSMLASSSPWRTVRWPRTRSSGSLARAIAVEDRAPRAIGS